MYVCMYWFFFFSEQISITFVDLFVTWNVSINLQTNLQVNRCQTLNTSVVMIMVFNATFNNVNRHKRWCIYIDWLIDWFGLWILLSLSTISWLYSRSQFYLQRKSEYMEKNADLSQVDDKLYHIMLHQIYLAMSRIQTHNFRRW